VGWLPVAFAGEVADGHGGDGPGGAEDDVQGHGDVVAERFVVEDVDGDEEGGEEGPLMQGDVSRFEVQVAEPAGGAHVGGEGEERGEQDLREGDERAAAGGGADDGFEGEDVGAAAAEDEGQDPEQVDIEPRGDDGGGDGEGKVALVGVVFGGGV
jgi:hypothetical protein